jgi:hypothetical protein
MSRKVLNIITIVLFVVSVIVGIFTFANSTAIKDGNSGLLNPLYYWTGLLLLATVVLALLMPLPAMLKNPKLLKRTLFIIIGIFVAFGIVYVLSQGKPDNEEIMSTLLPPQKDVYSKGFFIANMNIIAAEIALALAIVAILWSALKGIIKR